MASGHVNRIKRPNTWLHRPMLQNVKKALANPEPSTHGTFETCQPILGRSVHRGRPEVTVVRSIDANDGVDDARFRHRMCQRVIVEQRIT
jgi:hypothetical protein